MRKNRNQFLKEHQNFKVMKVLKLLISPLAVIFWLIVLKEQAYNCLTKRLQGNNNFFPQCLIKVALVYSFFSRKLFPQSSGFTVKAEIISLNNAIC